MTIVQQFQAARRVSTPIVAVATPDPAATVAALCEAVNGTPKGQAAPKLEWDCVRGCRSLNDSGKQALADMGLTQDESANPIATLIALHQAPKDSIVFFHNAAKFFDNPAYTQAIFNLRDPFKLNGRMLVLLAPAFTLPPELQHDTLVLDEPLPDAEQLQAIVRSVYAAASVPVDEPVLARAVEAVQGLAAFPAEQATAMSMSKAGLQVDSLWERKRQAIEQTPGLKVYRGGETFADIGGVEVIKGFLGKIVHGKARPNAVVFVDEIEKSMAGASGDSSGVSQDQLGTLLSHMQDHSAVGVILVGPPGAAKSLIAKATGNEAGIPTVQLDLGAAKSSLVGSSEDRIRTALKVVDAVSNGRALWVSTCNSLHSLPPELRRRFSLGVWFFDLPDQDERTAIWHIWRARYELDPADETPDDKDWTGAEIKQCCDLAWRLDCSLEEAARFIVPVAKSAGDQLNRLRELADGRFLSASHPGVYQKEQPERTNHKPQRRKIALAD